MLEMKCVFAIFERVEKGQSGSGTFVLSLYSRTLD
jgi:hypothetical protein